MKGCDFVNRADFVQAIHKKYIEDGRGSEGERFETYSALCHTGQRILELFENHECIGVSVSGGSDSDCIVHLICTYFPEYLYKCRFVFVNTGFEWNATKRHLQDLTERYGIRLDLIRGRSVVSAVRENGLPILSKQKSEMIRKYIAGQPHAVKYIFGNGQHKFHSFEFSEKHKQLTKFLDYCGIKISAKCCDYSKKKPLYEYQKKHGIDLNVTGERKAEGGQRAISQNSCFGTRTGHPDKFMPLFWWSDIIKLCFKLNEGIVYSDCYEVYGLRRTGCVGCPFTLDIRKNLEIMQEYEPKLYEACLRVFGRSYALMDLFQARRSKCLPEGLTPWDFLTDSEYKIFMSGVYDYEVPDINENSTEKR